MKKRLMLIALLLAAIFALCAFSPALSEEDDMEDYADGGEYDPYDYEDYDDYADEDDYDLPEDYDPSVEEHGGGLTVTAENSRKIYAGATPIPIDPIDMATPTPRPELTFTYAEYTAGKLGLTFKSAVGYEANENISGKYILTEPAAQVKDNYPCVITLEVSGITKNFSLADVKTSLSRYLADEGKLYDTWETWTAASKTLMNGKGYYNNYRGVLADGTVVRGRVHMAIINDSQMLTLHITCPGWFNSSYMKIYDTIRDSLKKI